MHLISGTTPLAAGTLDQPAEGVDLVVMDDFIYGEPQAARTRWNYLPQVVK